MNRRILAIILVGLSLAAAGCAKKSAQWSGVGAPMAMLMESPEAGTAGHFIAETHRLEVIAPESKLQKSWEAVVAFCGTIRCEVMSSSITAKSGEQQPSGNVSVRVVPADLQKLLERLQSLGQIATHTTQRVDKTTEVIDSDAKIKNLTTFRDNLRTMLGKPSATVKDLVDIQQQLADTQSQLDSETAQRKILANETEKIAVDISFRVARSEEQHGTFSEIWTALCDSGSTLADSVASLITVIVAVIPWFIVIGPAIWVLARAWGRYRRNRKRPSASSPVGFSQ
jgi:hypothetical protein